MAVAVPPAPCPPRRRRCSIKPGKSTQRMGPAKNTLRIEACVADTTVRRELVVTSLYYAANAAPTPMGKECRAAFSQACYHYRSAIRVNPQWATLTCPPEAAVTSDRRSLSATRTWSSQHRGSGWVGPPQKGECERDEFPPAYLLGRADPAYIFSGQDDRGQLIRWVPSGDNNGGGRMWKGTCFAPPLAALFDVDFQDRVDRAQGRNRRVTVSVRTTTTLAAITVNQRPEFTVTAWPQQPPNDGLYDNPCWPKDKAAQDPGFALLTYDPWYGGRQPPYDYTKPYRKGSNGS